MKPFTRLVVIQCVRPYVQTAQEIKLTQPGKPGHKTPTGRIPGNIMKFKIDENLKMVAAAKVAPVDLETVAVELCARFIDAGMIDSDPDNITRTVMEATGPRYVKDVCAVLAEYLYGDDEHSISADVFDAFCKLVIIGDGGCPDCGGELEYMETEGHELKDGDYLTPNSYVIDNYVYRCRECGEIIKSEKEL